MKNRSGVTEAMGFMLLRSFTCPLCLQPRIGFVLKETAAGTILGVKIAHHAMKLSGSSSSVVATVECPLSGLDAHEVEE